MELNHRQQRILQQKFDRELLEEGYRDRALDTTTDPERTKVVNQLPSVQYRNIEEEEALLEALTQ